MGADAFSRAAKDDSGVRPRLAASAQEKCAVLDEQGSSRVYSVFTLEKSKTREFDPILSFPNGSSVSPSNFPCSPPFTVQFQKGLGLAFCQALVRGRTGTGLVQAVPEIQPVQVPQAAVEGTEAANRQEASEGLLEADEAQLAQPLSTPDQPTEQMIREHEVSHIPYRAWCTACVRGRGRTMQHRRVDHSDNLIPTLSMDYGFLGDGLPFVVLRDRKSKAIFAHLLPHKGVAYSSFPERAILRNLAFLGYKRLVLKSDQESSLKALREAVANGYPAEVTCEDAPKGDAHGQSNGEAERAVQTIQGMVRTLVSHIEEKTGQPLGNTSPVIAWAVEHAATLHLLFSKDTELKDGLTPFQRIKGRAWHIPLPCFGEIVEFRKRTETKSEPRWESGIYLGTRITSSEKIIGTAQGTFVVQSLKRKPPSSQWDMDFLKEFKSLPWSLKPEGPTSIPAPADIAPELPDAVVQGPVRPAPKEEAGRRMYLRKADFDQFGFTAGCSACDALREGRSRAGILHSDHCRDRITSRLKDTPAGKDRLEANLERENKYLARYIEREDTVSKASASSRALPSTLEQGTPLPSAPVSHSPMPMTPTMEVEQPVDPEDKKRPLYEPASTMRQKVARASPTTSGIPAPSSRKRVAQDQGDEDRIRVLESDTRAEAQKRPLEPGGDLDQLLAQGEDLVDGALAAHRSAVLANLIAEQPHRPLADIKDEFEPWFLEQSFYDDNTGKPLPS